MRRFKALNPCESPVASCGFSDTRIMQCSSFISLITNVAVSINKIGVKQTHVLCNRYSINTSSQMLWVQS